MLLFYIRHGNPIYDPDSLTPLGERQAEAVAKRLALYGIDEIYASSSNRAKQTAVPTCEILRKEMTVLDWCNEHYAWLDLAVPLENGKRNWAFCSPKYKELFNSREVREMGMEWYQHPAFADTHFGDGIKRIGGEVEHFIRTLGYVHDAEKCGYFAEQPNERRVALFAHQGFGLAFLSLLLDIPYPVFCTHFDMSHTGMSVIEFPDQEGIVYPKLLQLSNDSHLYREGLPTKYNNYVYF